MHDLFRAEFQPGQEVEGESHADALGMDGREGTGVQNRPDFLVV